MSRKPLSGVLDEATLKKGGTNTEYQIPESQRPADPPPQRPPPQPPVKQD